jgi:hypothetical protein
MHRFTVLLITLLLCAATAVSAKRKPKDPCEILDVNKDAFGTITRSNTETFNWGRNAIGIVEVEGKVTFQVRVMSGGVFETVCPAGSKGKIALQNGTILEIATKKDAAPIKNVNQSGAYTQWIQEFDINPALLEKLASSPMKAIKVAVNGDDVSFEVPEDEGKDMLTAMTCIRDSAKPKEK